MFVHKKHLGFNFFTKKNRIFSSVSRATRRDLNKQSLITPGGESCLSCQKSKRDKRQITLVNFPTQHKKIASRLLEALAKEFPHHLFVLKNNTVSNSLCVELLATDDAPYTLQIQWYVLGWVDGIST
jgi:hypothetical protein